jgi:hypothetical protein
MCWYFLFHRIRATRTVRAQSPVLSAWAMLTSRNPWGFLALCGSQVGWNPSAGAGSQPLSLWLENTFKAGLNPMWDSWAADFHAREPHLCSSRGAQKICQLIRTSHQTNIGWSELPWRGSSAHWFRADTFSEFCQAPCTLRFYDTRYRVLDSQICSLAQWYPWLKSQKTRLIRVQIFGHRAYDWTRVLSLSQIRFKADASNNVRSQVPG